MPYPAPRSLSYAAWLSQNRRQRELRLGLRAAGQVARNCQRAGGPRWHSPSRSRYPSPMSIQEVWTNAKRRRQRKAWEGQPLDRVGHVIEWEPRKVACGVCGRQFGGYVGYRVRYPDGRLDREQGILEDTTGRYERNAATPREAGTRGPRSQPRFWLEREIGKRASRKATTWLIGCNWRGRLRTTSGFGLSKLPGTHRSR
jgi:hypothetical protein